MAAESKLESFMRREVEEMGGLFLKFRTTAKGYPDRLLLYRGHKIFVEMKAPGKVPNAQQAGKHKKLNKFGAEVVVIDTEQDMAAFLKGLVRRGPACGFSTF